MCIHGNNIYWGDNGVDLKVFNSITGVICVVCAAHVLRYACTGELIKYRTHPGKNVCTGAVDIVDDIIMCAGYDVDQGVAYINSMISHVNVVCVVLCVCTRVCACTNTNSKAYISISVST